MMFIQNKYTKWYYEIIENAKTRTLTGYKERHHIVPKCIGGPDFVDNIVPLTAREHFIVHLLLIRMVETKDVYKMVHAIIRFTKKVETARQYELLRKYVSKYSKGKYNASYGKIWIHDKKSQEIFFVPKMEFDESKHVKGLPYQRGGFSGYIWINNKKDERLIDPKLNMPKNWQRGRINSGTREQMIAASKKRHTNEKDMEHSKKLTGRKGITNTETGIKRRVHPIELFKYLSSGWVLTKKD